MKFLVTFVVFTLAVYHASASISFAHKNPPHPDCSEHNRYITAAQITELNRGEAPNNSIMQQHLLCIWKEKGAMNEAGVLQRENIKRDIVPAISNGPADTRKAVRCIVQKSTPTETAYGFYKCISPLLAANNH